MSFTFLHTADWQIGKPFRNFPDAISVLLREARLEAIDRLADAARGAGARHVLVAGDIYDTDRLPMKDLLQPVARMKKHDRLVWHLLPGNHDPAGIGSLWHRLAALGLPANVRPHLTPEPVPMEAGTWLLPAPLISRTASEDPTWPMQHSETPAGALRIGLAHGSVRGFGTADEASVRIDPKRVASAKLEYLALGDWHGLLEVSERCWYSGTPEPDSFDDNQPGHALIVRIPGIGVAPVVEPVATGRFRWAELSLRIDAIADLERIEAAIAELGVAEDRIVLRLKLTGQASLETRSEIERHLARLEPRLRHLTADLGTLLLAPTGEDLARLAREGEIGAAATRLQQLAMTGTPDEQAAAGRALARLYQMVKESEQEPAKTFARVGERP